MPLRVNAGDIVNVYVAISALVVEWLARTFTLIIADKFSNLIARLLGVGAVDGERELCLHTLAANGEDAPVQALLESTEERAHEWVRHRVKAHCTNLEKIINYKLARLVNE